MQIQIFNRVAILNMDIHTFLYSQTRTKVLNENKNRTRINLGISLFNYKNCQLTVPYYIKLLATNTD